MSYYSIKGETLQDMADAIRKKTGKTDGLKPDEMASEIAMISGGSGIDTSGATVSADEILQGEIAYANGVEVVGTMPNNGTVSKTLDTNSTSYTIPKGYHSGSGEVSIATETKTATPTKNAHVIYPTSGKVLSSVSVAAIPSEYITTFDATATADEILQGKTAYVDGEKVAGTIQTKTSSNLTVSGATVTVPAGYYASQATKSVSTATQATPSISVSSSGLITASATQTAGYVSAGTKSGTKQLTTQAAKTITPTKSSQTAVAKDVYTTGAVTVAAIPSQYITTTDATAAAADIRSSKTAYVNGSKVTGTLADFDGSYECSGDSTGGSGSGGASVATCTVSISSNRNIAGHLYTIAENGQSNVSCSLTEDYNDTSYGKTITVNNLVCGTVLVIDFAISSGEWYSGLVTAQVDGDITILNTNGLSTTSMITRYIFKASSTAGSSSSVYVHYDS